MKKSIADAAVKIIISEGYENLSIRKIASLIDYSPTTIYNYYKDKAEIISYMMNQMYYKIVAECRRVIEENINKPIDQILRISLKAFLQCTVSEPEIGKAILLSGKSMFTKDADDDTGMDLLSDILQEGEKLGILRKLDNNVAYIIITNLLGLSFSIIENKLYNTVQYDHLADVFCEMTMRGLLSNEYIQRQV